MTKMRISITMSYELVKEIRKIQFDKIRKTTKLVSFSEVLEHYITSNKKFHIKDSAHNRVRKSITITSKTLKKLQDIQSDKQAKSEKRVGLSGIIEDHLLNGKKA